MSSKTSKLEFHKNKDGIVSKNKETNKDQWITRVMQVIGKENGEKMSLPMLKKKLREEYGLNMNLTRNKFILKRALSTCVEEKKIEKIGDSFQSIQDKNKNVNSAEEIDEHSFNHPPKDGVWLGLRIETQEKAKTGRSTCKNCDKIIEKDSCRLKVLDNSLFKMCIAPGDHHEGVFRGYVEGVPPDNRTVSKKTFFIHESCVKEANAKFEEEFRNEWAIIQPHMNFCNDMK